MGYAYLMLFIEMFCTSQLTEKCEKKMSFNARTLVHYQSLHNFTVQI